MVRIPNSPHEWAEHVHTTGRKFLSNLTTSETRWLWTKWDMNGRLFVRNTTDPNKRVWVDEMDLPMKIESGTASPSEIQQYVTSIPRFISNPPPTATTTTGSAANATKPQSRPSAHHQNHQLQSQPQLKFHQPHHQHHHQPNPYKPLSHTLAGPFSHQHYRPSVATAKHAPRVEKRERGTRFGTELKPGGSQSRPSLDHSNRTVAEPVKNSAYVDALSNQRHPITQNSQNARNFASPTSPHVPANEAAPLKRPTRESFRAARLQAARDAPKRRRFDPPLRSTPLGVNPLRALSYVPHNARRLHNFSASLPHHHVFDSVYEHRVRGSSAPEGSANTLDPDSDEVYLHEPIVGTCEEKEKEYLRLTSAPKPEAVRPPRILRLSLAHIKSIWSDGSKGYGWVCRQLKSIRQDYTVQAIFDRNVVDVYETHARIALENGDLGEFNTCVAQVQRLFDKVDCSTDEHDEFATYRILYSVITSAKAWQVQREFAKLSPKQRQWSGVHFAWQVCRAVKRDDYHDYFTHAARPPRHTVAHFLLAYLDRRMRHLAIRAMVAAYGPGQPALLPLKFVATELGWAPRDFANEHSKTSSFVLPEKVLGSDDQNAIDVVRKLGLVREPAWVFQVVGFLTSINVILVANGGASASREDSSRADTVSIDCRSTKSQGVGELKTNGKLITHAGSVSRSWS